MNDPTDLSLIEKIDVAIEKKLTATIGGKVDAEVKKHVDAKIKEQVEKKIEEQVEQQIRIQVDARITKQVNAKFKRRLDAAIERKIRHGFWIVAALSLGAVVVPSGTLIYTVLSTLAQDRAEDVATREMVKQQQLFDARNTTLDTLLTGTNAYATAWRASFDQYNADLNRRIGELNAVLGSSKPKSVEITDSLSDLSGELAKVKKQAAELDGEVGDQRERIQAIIRSAAPGIEAAVLVPISGMEKKLHDSLEDMKKSLDARMSQIERQLNGGNLP